MTTIEQPTGPAHIEASLVQLILLRSSARLPMPQYRVVSDDSISLEFASPTALAAWADELTKRGATSTGLHRDDDNSCDFMTFRGWPCTVRLRARYEQPEPSQPLDDATLDALAAVTS